MDCVKVDLTTNGGIEMTSGATAAVVAVEVVAARVRGDVLCFGAVVLAAAAAAYRRHQKPRMFVASHTTP